jgi:hypothetical protein
MTNYETELNEFKALIPASFSAEQKEIALAGFEEGFKLRTLLEKAGLVWEFVTNKCGFQRAWCLKAKTSCHKPSMDFIHDFFRKQGNKEWVFRGHADLTMLFSGRRDNELIEALEALLK